jgi:hypothetical protein
MLSGSRNLPVDTVKKTPRTTRKINAGASGDVVVAAVESKASSREGWNALTGVYEDLV